MPEIAQRRVASSEIVDHDAHSTLTQRSQLLTRAFEVVNQRILSDLEHQSVRVNTRLRDRLIHRIHDAGVGELLRRKIDRDRYWTSRNLLPAARLHAGLADYPLANRRDESGFFQEPEKIRRR